MLESHKELIQSAFEAGQEGRRAVLKDVTGIERAEIGCKKYSKEDIESIKRRRTRVQASTETKILHVTVEEIDVSQKSDPLLSLRELGTENKFKANLNLEIDDEDDIEEIMNLIWNSARYSDRHFWAEVLLVTRRDKLEKATLLNIAEEKEDLLNKAEDIDI